MSEDARWVVGLFYDGINEGNFGVIDELVADDFIDREEFPGFSQDKEGVWQFFTTFRAAFPDLRMDAHEVVIDGDLACVRSTMSGTHEGNFMGLPPSGRRFEVTGFDMVRIRDGEFVEHWGLIDSMKMMLQLGAVPEQALV